MKIELRTNEDDWRQVKVDDSPYIYYHGHSIPEPIWIRLLREAGVDVEVVLDDFGHGD